MTETIKNVMETLIEYANGGVSGLYPPEEDIQELVDYILDLQEEIERLNNIINKIDVYVNKLRYYADEDEEKYKISKDIHNIIQELKGSDK